MESNLDSLPQSDLEQPHYFFKAFVPRLEFRTRPLTEPTSYRIQENA